MALAWFRLNFTEKRTGKALYVDFQADEKSALTRYRSEYKKNRGARTDWKLAKIDSQSGCVEKIIAMNEA